MRLIDEPCRLRDIGERCRAAAQHGRGALQTVAAKIVAWRTVDEATKYARKADGRDARAAATESSVNTSVALILALQSGLTL